MKALKFYISLLGLAIILSFSATSAEAQCAMCRSSVESANKDKENLSKFGNGLNKGILYLMAIPYLLAGTVGYLWYRNSKKQ